MVDCLRNIGGSRQGTVQPLPHQMEGRSNLPTITTEAVPAHGLRAHLIALVLVVLLPSIALGAATAWHIAGNFRAAFEERLSGTAQALALALDREVQTHIAALTALAASPRFNDDDLAGFYAHARGAAEALGTPVAVVGADLRQRLHTDRAFGAPLPVTAATAAMRRAYESGLPVVSDYLVGAVLDRPVVAVLVPVTRRGRVVAVLTAPISPDRLSTLLASQGLSEGGFAALLDGHNVVMARSSDAARFQGQKAPDRFVAASAGRDAAILQGHSLTGEDVILAYRRLTNAPDWTLVMAEPLASYEASWQRPLLALGFGGTATFVVALMSAAWLGRRILHPVKTLAQQAEAVSTSGGKVPLAKGTPARVAEFEFLRLAMRHADAAIRARAAEAAAGEARLQAIVDTAVDAIIVIDEAGTIQSFNRAAEAIFGYSAAEAVGQNVTMLMGAEHGRRHGDYLAAYRLTGERKVIGVGREVEGRRKDGSFVPLDLALAEWRDAAGKRFFTGIMRDISARRADEARKTLLMREVDHRAKNVLAVVQSVIRLTARDKPEAFATAVEARVAALARTHSLLAEGGWHGADFRAVAERALAPYTPMLSSGTVRLDGPSVPLVPAAVQPIALVLHELATNAARYGALSVPGGAVTLGWWWSRGGGDDRLHLRWAETDGVPVPGTPTRQGFGTRLIDASVRGQLGGSVTRRWESTGLICEISIPLARAVAAGNEAAGTGADADIRLGVL
jgi:PAS domain S-box-containing protein